MLQKFGERNDDHRGLGDWYVNENKIKGGLKKLVDRINGLGLKFGLWVEPKMINEDSDLYRSHPDWVLKDPDRLPMVSRNQMVLDMSRADVRDYLFACISALLSESNIEYIKWDFNRSVANVYSNLLAATRQGEVMHRFVLGTYDLLARIKEAFPDVLIEGCAGGGGRFDAGMLFYTPQIWCSDNTDPIARLKIQKGTSYGYPVSTMGSHVSAPPSPDSYTTFGISYDKISDNWIYDGKIIHILYDANHNTYYDNSASNGINLKVIRDKHGVLRHAAGT